MNIVLIGYRGTGKTSVAKVLEGRIKMCRVSLDDEIVKKMGVSIPSIVEEFGWDKFRDVESEVVEEWGKKDNMILDCGGGVVLRRKNIDSLKANGKVFLLKSSVEKIAKRIKDGNNRPALTGKSFVDEIKYVLNEREGLYNNTKDYEIDCTDLSIEEIAKIIEEKWQEISSEKSFK